MTNQQVLRLWKIYERTGNNLTISALKSGMDRKTARKYLNDGRLPSEMPQSREFSARSEAIAQIWPSAEELLEITPDLEAKALFEHLLAQYPEIIQDNQLRTFQRRVKTWRAQHGPVKEVYFDQISKPGEFAQLDWVDMNKIGITINGEPLKHKLCHFVLNYSNFESASRCQSESMLSITKGLRKFVFSMGHVPETLQVDNSSAATHQVSKSEAKRDFNTEYIQLLKHYGIKAKKNNVGKPNENGDVESQNGHLKRRIGQELLLRLSNNFNSLVEYDKFIDDVLKKTNKKRQARLQEELKVMAMAPSKPPTEYQEMYVTVKSGSVIRIKKVTYSVPSKLIGIKYKIKIYEDRIDLNLGTTLVHSMPRFFGDSGKVINYRHVIHSLVRKPGAFSNYKFREEMYPSPKFKKSFEVLVQLHGERKGTLDYLRILKLAADNTENDVEIALDLLLEDSSLSYESVLGLMKSEIEFDFNSIELTPELTVYDKLLEEKNYVDENNNGLVNQLKVKDHEFNLRKDCTVSR